MKKQKSKKFATLSQGIYKTDKKRRMNYYTKPGNVTMFRNLVMQAFFQKYFGIIFQMKLAYNE